MDTQKNKRKEKKKNDYNQKLKTLEAMAAKQELNMVRNIGSYSSSPAVSKCHIHRGSCSQFH